MPPTHPLNAPLPELRQMDKSETENEEDSETKSETKAWKERLKREIEKRK